MEAFLFIIITILLIVNNSKLKSLTKHITSLEGKVDSLRRIILKSNAEASRQKRSTQVKTETKPKPIIEPPKAVANEKVLDIIKPKTAAKKVQEKTIVTQQSIPKTKAKPTQTAVPKKTIGILLQEKMDAFKKSNPDIETFIGENLISKIGILILVLGISFFVKFAIDNEWINEVGRVGIGFLSGGILLGFAHRLQKKYKAFSSVLVSGAITIFYFVITYAFKEYELFNQTVAFGLLVLVTIFSVTISVLYDRKELGVLSLIGGFAVPVLTSTGSGSYIVLFSYILILNLGFLFLSIKKRWLIINVLTFVFTHLFFFSWVADDSELSENSLNLFLFATAFYFIFYLMNVFRIIKEKEYVIKPIVMSLFLISTFVYFGQGLLLLDYFAPAFKGVFTLALALVNLVTGWFLFKDKKIDKKTVYLFIGMTLTFLTLVGPIQLEGNYITLFWAAESALLIWLSQKMKNNDIKIVAFITTVLMLGSLLVDFEQIYYSPEAKLNIIFNKGFITGIFSVITLSVSAFFFHKEKENYFINKFEINPNKTKIGLLILAGIVLYLTGSLELSHQTQTHFDSYLSTIIMAIYNFVFVSTGIYFAFKSKLKEINTAGVTVSAVALVVIINLINFIPFRSFAHSKRELTSNPTFFVQFILFFIAMYIIKLIYDFVDKADSKDTYAKILQYFIATAFVILVSLEVLIISQPLLVNSKIADVAPSLIDTFIHSSKIAVIKTSFPILWGILSFIFLFFGIKKNKKEYRIFALALIAITIIKLFTYDIGNVSQAGKIVAFIILGIVLLVISFMYQRIKKLFNDENDEA